MSKHHNYPYTTLWTGPLMDGWTRYFMDWPHGWTYRLDTLRTGLRTDRLNALWTGPTEGNTKRILYRLASKRERQTGDLMDWFTDGQTDWIHVLYGLAHRKMGWILIFMDWPTNGTTLQVATILVTMAPKILKLAT